MRALADKENAPPARSTACQGAAKVPTRARLAVLSGKPLQLSSTNVQTPLTDGKKVKVRHAHTRLRSSPVVAPRACCVVTREGVSSRAVRGAEGHDAEAARFGSCRAGPTEHISCGCRSQQRCAEIRKSRHQAAIRGGWYHRRCTVFN